MTSAKTQTGKQIVGTVVSDKMKDTAVVSVYRYVKHTTYRKYMKVRKRYKVHDPGNTVKVGDTVTIVETRPISRHKHFRILRSEGAERL